MGIILFSVQDDDGFKTELLLGFVIKFVIEILLDVPQLIFFPLFLNLTSAYSFPTPRFAELYLYTKRGYFLLL